MGLEHLQHFLIQTVDLRATANWYVDVLGMEEGPHPDFGFPVVWLYVGGNDVLHLTEGGGNVSDERKQYLSQDSTAVTGSGVVDHVAFRASGLKGMLEHLKAKDQDFVTRQVSDQGLFQVFLHDPNGVKVELNFEHAEATDIQAEFMPSQKQ